MKNLKQVLALGMAFSLTMSTMAGAAFSDQDSINSANSDAVELLTTLDVIQGFEDGSFRPEETVTRAQMAKMIYTIRNGGNDNADAYKSATTTFTDIKGHWAEGYIKYLQNTGIIAGKSETVFDPDAVVTTAEAMKMALVLGGYRADKADLTGATWFNNTVSLATTNQLTDDVYSAMNGECTRQDAAQILANTLGMTAVQWSEFTQSFLNDSDDGLALGGEKITVGYKWMDLTTYVGRLVSSGDLKINGGSSAGNNQFIVAVDTVNDIAAGKYLPSNYLNNITGSYEVTFKDGIDHTDIVGQEVKVLTGDKLDEVYGVYTTGTSKVVETTMDKVEVDSANDKFKIDDTKYSVDYSNHVYADTKDTDVKTVFTSNGQAVSDKVKLIDWDNNGKYETILTETASVAKVTYVGTDSITIGEVGSRNSNIVGNKKTFENSEINIYEGVAKGDYVVITRDDYNTDKWNIEKTTTVTGTVDGVVKNERKVRVDGTWYTLANTKADTETPKDGMFDLLTIDGGVESFANKDEVTLYLVGDIAYYAESTRGNDANRSVAMVYDLKVNAGGWNNNNQAKIILADGTKKTVSVTSDSNTVKFADLEQGMIYYYTENNDGDYLFTALSNTEKAGYDAWATDANGLDDSNSYAGKVIADDAIVFAYIADKEDAVVYTGKTVKDAKRPAGWGKAWKSGTESADGTTYQYADNGVALSEKNNGFDYNRMISIAINESDKLNKTSNYGYLVTDGTYSYNKEMGSYVMEYSYWNGSEVVNAIEKTSSNKERWATKGSVISFSTAEDGMIKDVTDVESLSAASADKLYYASMTGVDTKGGYVALKNEDNTTTQLEVTSDTVFLYVNSDAATDKIGVSGSGYDYAVTTGEVNVGYVATVDGKVKFMVIDVDGKLSGHDKITTTTVGATQTDVNNELVNGSKTVVNVNNNLTVDNVTVPEGKTLVVNGDLTVGTGARATGTLTINGTLIVNGKLTVESGYAIEVATGAVAKAEEVSVASADAIKGEVVVEKDGTSQVYKFDKDATVTVVNP